MSLRCVYRKNDSQQEMFRLVEGAMCPVVEGYTLQSGLPDESNGASESVVASMNESGLLPAPDWRATGPHFPMPLGWPPGIDWPPPGWPPPGWPPAAPEPNSPPPETDVLKQSPKKTISRSTQVLFLVNYCNDRIDLKVNSVTVLSLTSEGQDAGKRLDNYRIDLTQHLTHGDNNVVVECYNRDGFGRCSFDLQFTGQSSMSWDVADSTQRHGARSYSWFHSAGLRLVVVRG